jgi:outer membrane protein TolC
MHKTSTPLRLAAIGLLWFSASAVRAEAPSPERPEPPPPTAADAGPQLERITLDMAIRRALERNVTYAIAVQEIRRAQALVVEARASSLPTLTGNGVYTRLDDDRRFNNNVILSRDQLAGNVTLTVPLIVPQRWAVWSHASTNVDVARASAGDARRQTALAVARAYLAVISQKRVIEAGERAVVNANAHYAYAHTRLAGGVGNRVDDVRAEQELTADKAQVESEYAGLARTREALGILLGEDAPLDAADEFVLADAPPLDAALAEAVSRRSDVAVSKARLDAAEKVRKDGYTDYLPFLLGTFQPFYQQPASLTQPHTGWQAQLLLTVPLYDGGLRYGLADERAVLSVEARTEYDAIVRQARSDVRVAFETVKRAEASLEAATRAAELARDALELANLAYRAGATTNLEVIDAERRARDAETQMAVSEDSARQARLDLLTAAGRFP